jgi:transcriptional antiterminator
MEENIVIRAISKNEFSNTDREIFNAVSKASNLYEEICHVKPTEEEFITLTMHFALSHKRNIKRKKAILVCNNGITDGIILCRYISEAVPEIEIVDICSSFQLTCKAENEYDFVISTVSLNGIQKPIADLSHAVKNDYTKFFEEFMFSLS